MNNLQINGSNILFAVQRNFTKDFSQLSWIATDKFTFPTDEWIDFYNYKVDSLLIRIQIYSGKSIEFNVVGGKGKGIMMMNKQLNT